jgi:hypothetical protein
VLLLKKSRVIFRLVLLLAAMQDMLACNPMMDSVA